MHVMLASAHQAKSNDARMKSRVLQAIVPRSRSLTGGHVHDIAILRLVNSIGDQFIKLAKGPRSLDDPLHVIGYVVNLLNIIHDTVLDSEWMRLDNIQVKPDMQILWSGTLLRVKQPINRLTLRSTENSISVPTDKLERNQSQHVTETEVLLPTCKVQMETIFKSVLLHLVCLIVGTG